MRTAGGVRRRSSAAPRGAPGGRGGRDGGRRSGPRGRAARAAGVAPLLEPEPPLTDTLAAQPRGFYRRRGRSGGGGATRR